MCPELFHLFKKKCPGYYGQYAYKYISKARMAKNASITLAMPQRVMKNPVPRSAIEIAMENNFSLDFSRPSVMPLQTALLASVSISLEIR